ncbi:MAG: transporter [Nitrospirae bacterium]|nr:transporter [Nitrospirota bacterium]
MMTSRVFLLGLMTLLALLQSRPVFALLPYLDSETAVPVDRGKSRLDVSLQLDRWNSRLSTDALEAELSYGLINNLDFSVDVPYLVRKVKGSGDVNGAGDEDGVGDVTLKVKIRFIKGREANPVSIAGQLTVKFPSCNKNKALSPECTGEPDVGLRAIASKEFFPVTVHLNLGYIFVGNPANTNLNDVLTYSLAFDYLTTADYLHVVGELAGQSNRYPKTSDEAFRLSAKTSADPLSALVGLLYDLDINKALTVSWSMGLTQASPDYSLSAGFRYLF